MSNNKDNTTEVQKKSRPARRRSTKTAAAAEKSVAATAPAKATATKTRAAQAPAKKSGAAKKAATKNGAAQATAKVDISVMVKAPNRTLAAELDRDSLPAKTRVHALAKHLAMTSRDLVEVITALGMKKVAASTLSRAEADRILDALAAPAEVISETKEAVAEPLEKIRQRVEKNVANEIHQIEEKVERETQARAQEAAGAAEAGEDQTGTSPTAATEEATVDEQNLPVEHAAPVAENAAASTPRRRTRKRVVRRTTSAPAAQAAPVATEETAPASARPEPAPTHSSQSAATDDAGLADVDTPVVSEYVAARAEQVIDAPLFLAPTTPAVEEAVAADSHAEPSTVRAAEPAGLEVADSSEEEERPTRRRRGRRGTSRGRGKPEVTAVEEEAPAASKLQLQADEQVDEPVALKGSTRLESQRRHRAERREEARRSDRIVSQAEFLARRESVKRTMVVRERQRHDQHGMVTQVGVLEDDLLVEHFVTSETQASIVGNVYLGRVQNVLPSMEAAFIDIGTGRNAVLYAGEVNWRDASLKGAKRRIEQALRSGDQVVVQVTKDPLGHKGARLTTQISLAGRYMVYVPEGKSTGISRKLSGPERARLREILKEVVPAGGGAIIRTAAEGVSKEAIEADVRRLHAAWDRINEVAEEEKNSKGTKPVPLYEEPDMLVKVVRDVFNEDFTELVVDGTRAWNTVHAYVNSIAPDLVDRLHRYDRGTHNDQDAFQYYRIDEQLHKALARMVWLPSGGSLVIDRTEAMTVIDVNTGRFTGTGGNLEETVTRNNLEAAEEIVRQLRLRDIGGMVVIDFIDMVLPQNRDLVLRRLTEALGRDRTRHQVSEVTSLGLVQLTRKRLGTGLLETFSTPCEHCEGRGVILHDDPVENTDNAEHYLEADRERRRSRDDAPQRSRRQRPRHHSDEEELEALAASVVLLSDDDQDTHSEAAGSDAAAPTPSTQAPVGASGESTAEAGTAARAERRERSGRRRARTPRRDSSRQQQPETTAEAASPERTAPVDPEAAYQEAVAAFEASPRRKRATRGNSKSDHRPRREDFQPAEQPEATPAADPQASEERPVESASRRRRVRRLAARDRKRADQVQPESAPQEGQQPAESAVREAESGPATEATEEVQVVRRGRRRAIRRNSLQARRERRADRGEARRQAVPEGSDAATGGAAAAAAEEHTHEVVVARRGRRRATRRRFR